MRRCCGARFLQRVSSPIFASTMAPGQASPTSLKGSLMGLLLFLLFFWPIAARVVGATKASVLAIPLSLLVLWFHRNEKTVKVD